MIKISEINQTLWDSVTSANATNRKYICKQNFAYFVFYYFAEFFTFKAAPFHWDLYHDCNQLISGDADEVAWIAHRESAKTSIAKMYVTYCICYKLEDYINWDSYDKTNAEQSLFDIITILQTNRRIIDDFGLLFKDGKKKKEGDPDEPKMKRIGEFITENKIKVEAFSTQQSTRGRQFYDPTTKTAKRPGLYVLDDFENSVTKESLPVMAKIKAHIDELKSGLSTTGKVLYLGNLLTEEGVVTYIMDSLEGKPGKICRNIPVVDSKGNISWPDKYVKTNQEAIAANINIPERAKWKVSLQKKRQDLGDIVFETEMMNNPGKSGDYYFDREKVRLARDKARDPIKTVALFKTWGTYDARHRYGLGADTAEGIGADSSTTAIMDFTQRPACLIASYKNNEIPPSTFAHEIKRHGEIFGECFVIPEINNTGYATVAELVNLKYWNQYQREVKNKTTNKVQKEYGWRTTSGVKHDVFSQFKTAFEDGEVEIFDIDVLNEMYHYTKQRLQSQKKEEGMTRHFDLLTAVVLAWEARRYATVSAADKKEMYKAPKRTAYEV